MQDDISTISRRFGDPIFLVIKISEWFHDTQKPLWWQLKHPDVFDSVSSGKHICYWTDFLLSSIHY